MRRYYKMQQNKLHWIWLFDVFSLQFARSIEQLSSNIDKKTKCLTNKFGADCIDTKKQHQATQQNQLRLHILGNPGRDSLKNSWSNYHTESAPVLLCLKAKCHRNDQVFFSMGWGGSGGLAVFSFFDFRKSCKESDVGNYVARKPKAPLKCCLNQRPSNIQSTFSAAFRSNLQKKNVIIATLHHKVISLFSGRDDARHNKKKKGKQNDPFHLNPLFNKR